MKKNTSPLNVIYLHTHDMGRYNSVYGYAIPTPNIHRFASRSTTFHRAFCAGPTCSPSRAGLLTGQSAHSAGMIGLAHKGFKLADPQQHLGNFLKKHGYTTALFGIQHEFDKTDEQDLAKMPYDYTVRNWHPDGCLQSDHRWTNAAVEYLQRHHEQPFFLSLGLFYPHRPFLPADPEKFPAGYIKPPDPIPDTPETRQDMADYHQSMFEADACLGRVMDTLRAQGLDQNSILIVTTDHGPAFPGMKCNLTDHGIGVSLIMDYPGNPSRGKVANGLVSQIDVFPTLCEILNFPAPEYLQGQSLLPIFEDPDVTIRDAVFAEVTYHAAYEPMRCVRTDRYNTSSGLARKSGVPRTAIHPLRNHFSWKTVGPKPILKRTSSTTCSMIPVRVRT
ncbi:MAG: sulfatase family protein [Puniceicoccales bacterium]